MKGFHRNAIYGKNRSTKKTNLNSKMVKKQRYAVSYGEFENEKKKGQNFFDLPELRFKPQVFSNFPTHDLNFHQK